MILLDPYSLKLNREDMNPLAEFNRSGSSTVDISSFTNPLLKVVWNIGNFCNYSCSYCAKECHDGTHPWPSLDVALNTARAINTVYKKEPFNKQMIVFEMMGGEVTVWKDLEKLSDLIQEDGNLCTLLTNGSRSLDWWQKNALRFPYVTLSYHPEFADYRHITAVSNILADAGVGTSILLLMYPDRWNYLMESHTYFKKHSRAGSIALQPLTYIETSREAQTKGPSGLEHDRWPYTSEQLDWIQKTCTHQNPENPPHQNWVSMRLGFFKDNDPSSLKEVDPAYLSSHGLNNWKNWDCYIGVDSLYLEQNGDVRREAMCRATKPIANWKHDELLRAPWPVDPIRCPFNACYCADDFKVRKIRR